MNNELLENKHSGKISFFADFINKYGITEEDNHILVRRLEDDIHKVNTKYFSEDGKGNIKILYPTLDGDVYTYESDSKSNPTKWLYNVRLREVQKDSNGNVIKYKLPKGATNCPFFPKSTIQKFQSNTSINTLFIVEGEKKAFLMSLKGLDAIGITGIHGWVFEKNSKKLHPDIKRLVTTCKVRNVVFLQDADVLTIKYDSGKDLSKRPSSFYNAVKDFNLSMEPLIRDMTVKRVFFTHIKTEYYEIAKGIDDLLLLDLEKSTDIINDLQQLNNSNKYFSTLNLTNLPDTKIKGYFGLDRIDNFHKIYERFIGLKDFIWKGTEFIQFNGKYISSKPKGEVRNYQWPKELLKNLEENIEREKIANEWDKEVNLFNFISTEFGYYRAIYDNSISRNVYFQKFSNFTIKVLFHISANKSNKRLIELTNYGGASKSLEIETKQMTSLQLFKETVEGQGNFIFTGKISDLENLKSKLYSEERPCVQIDVLGWNTKNFFAFCNGIYTDNGFLGVDNYGIVSFENTNYYIPFDINEDRNYFLNEKKFRYMVSEIDFRNWAEVYHNAFGDVGMAMLVFSCSCAFSDIIYDSLKNFPIAFLYGEGGSGKSKIASFLQYLWGYPQPALKLSEPANTAKAKIRMLAQFVNSLAVMEEFTNSLDISTIKTLTGIYDRFGYQKSSLYSIYGTETVPISSGVVITGNYIPSDDPLIQRLLFFEYNKNEHSEFETENYEQLKKINNEGLSHILGEILRLRNLFKSEWDIVYLECKKKFREKTKLIVATDRMKESYSVLLATYKILHDRLKFPFSYEYLESFLCANLKSHSEKRETEGDVQRFWNIVYELLRKGEIPHNKIIHLKGGELALKVKEVHSMYLRYHYDIYRSQGLSQSSLREKLINWKEGFIQKKESYRAFGGSSCLIFNLNAIQVDILSLIHK